MKAAICRLGEIVVDELADPVPVAGQVLVKTLACGICGSDLHHVALSQKAAEGASATGGLASDPGQDLVLGHEFVAEILEYGEGSHRKFPIGTRVSSIPIMLNETGVHPVGFSSHYSGGYAEKMLLSEDLLLELPNNVPTEYAALTEPMAVGLHAVEKASWQGEEVAIVLGCGAIGLAVIAMLKQKGVSTIIAADLSAGRRDLARSMGADIVVNPAQDSPYEAWQKVAVPDGVDPEGLEVTLGLTKIRGAVLFECVGVQGIIQQMLVGAPKAAQIIVVGVCDKEDKFEPSVALRKELTLQFAYAYTPEEFAQTLHLIADGDVNVEPMITGKVGLSEVAQAFEDLANPEKHAKILIEPWR